MPYLSQRRMPKQPAELRVLPGLYWHRITEKSQKQFFEDEWVVGTEVDRMGYRFKGGTQLEFVDREAPFGAGSDPSNIVDSCYPYGSIQVPSGCEPIILHRDAVSGGGVFHDWSGDLSGYGLNRSAFAKLCNKIYSSHNGRGIAST
jgi:allophanate hydrolase subunit 2